MWLLASVCVSVMVVIGLPMMLKTFAQWKARHSLQATLNQFYVIANSARKNFRFKSCRSILKKVPLKSGANQVDLAKASEVAVDLHEHCTLVLKYRAT